MSPLDYEVIGGGPFPDDVDAFLRGAAFQALVQAGLSSQLATVKPTPIRVGFLGDIVRVRDIVLTTGVLDGRSRPRA